MNNRPTQRLDATELVRNAHHAEIIPINSLMNLTEIVLSEVYGPINEEIRSDVTDIAAEVVRLQAVCERLVDLCRVDGMPIVCESLDVLDPIRVAINEVNQPGKTLHRFLPAELPPVRANADCVHELILRLITHAFRFADQVTIHVGREAERIVVRVGRGAKLPEFVPEDFEPLLDSWLENELAVDLLICQRLVDVQDGTFWTRCPPDDSPILCFSLPLIPREGG